MGGNLPTRCLPGEPANRHPEEVSAPRGGSNLECRAYARWGLKEAIEPDGRSAGPDSAGIRGKRGKIAQSVLGSAV